MRAYSLHRPVGMGTYPKPEEGDWEIVNFHERRWVDEIQHYAFGYVDYEMDVPICELDRYEMVSPCDADDDANEMLARYAKHIAHRITQGWESQAERLFERGVDKFGFDRIELYDAVTAALGDA